MDITYRQLDRTYRQMDRTYRQMDRTYRLLWMHYQRDGQKTNIYICKENISISIENIEFIKLNKADPWNLNCIYQGFYKRFDRREF